MWKLLPLLVLLLPPQDESVEDLVDRYFAEEDKGKRNAILKKLAEFPLGEVEDAIRKGTTGKPVEKDDVVVTRELTTEVGRKKFECRIYIPKGYDPSKRYRFFLSLHGQNGNGKNHIGLWLGDMEKRDDTFLAAPTVIDEGWGGTKRAHSHVITVLKYMLKTYSIDPNQVWLGGVSAGGNGTFRMAGYQADKWVGLIPRIQGPRFMVPPGKAAAKDYSNVIARHIENLRHTPLYWIVGKNDPGVPIALMRVGRDQLKKLGYDVTFREMEGGHEWYPQENAGVLKWMEGNTREPYPEQVTYFSNTKDYTRGYWTEISKFSKMKTITYRIMTWSGKQAGTRVEYVEDASIEAELKKEDNAIEAKVDNAAEVIFYLSDKMLDLEKPVIIRINGKQVHKKKVKRSLKFLLDDTYKRMDRGMVFSAKVKVRVP